MRVTEGRAAYILFNILKSSSAQGKWVIPANCCSVIPAVFCKSGTPFEICDISASTFCLDINSVSEIISREPSAYAGVLFIYTYGVNADFDSSIAWFKEKHPAILFVEDKCLCKPEIEADSSGVSDAVLYSTGYAKYSDMGGGGYAYISEGSLPYVRHRLVYQKSEKDEMDRKVKDAINGRMKLPPSCFSTDWLSSEPNLMVDAEYFAQLKIAVEISQRLKNEINRIYMQLLPEECCMSDEYNQWRYNIIVNEPQLLAEKIFSEGLFASRHYFPANKYVASDAQSAPVAEYLYRHVVNLFNDKYASVMYAEKICELVKSHVARWGCPG